MVMQDGATGAFNTTKLNTFHRCRTAYMTFEKQNIQIHNKQMNITSIDTSEQSTTAIKQQPQAK